MLISPHIVFKKGNGMDRSITHTHLVDSNFVLNSLFFDWFSVAVEASFQHLLAVLDSSFPSFDFAEVAPRSGYDQAFNIYCDGFVFQALFGGSNVGTRMMLVSSGANAEPFRKFFLEAFCFDPVSFVRYDPVLVRADVAVDFEEADIFHTLTDILTKVSDDNRLKRSCLGDWISSDDAKGRTLYVGSRQSPVMARLYEKGKTLVDKRPNLCRLELEIKPKRYASRSQYVAFTARDLVFCNAWSSSLFTVLSGISHNSGALPPGTVHRDTDHERAFAHMVKQYRSTIQKELDILGGDHMMLLSLILGDSL